jgi:hypothetical protein
MAYVHDVTVPDAKSAQARVRLWRKRGYNARIVRNLHTGFYTVEVSSKVRDNPVHRMMGF